MVQKRGLLNRRNTVSSLSALLRCQFLAPIEIDSHLVVEISKKKGVLVPEKFNNKSVLISVIV